LRRVVCGFLLVRVMTVVCASNVPDIDVWCYTSENLLALCCLLWTYRLP